MTIAPNSSSHLPMSCIVRPAIRNQKKQKKKQNVYIFGLIKDLNVETVMKTVDGLIVLIKIKTGVSNIGELATES